MVDRTDAAPPAPLTSRPFAGRRLALACAAILVAAAASAETLLFDGRIEAAGRAVLSSRLDGVVAAILFEGGERVERGQPLIRLDPADAELALAAAQALLAEAQARREGAERRAARQEALLERGVAAGAQVGPARTERAAAQAGAALAQAGRDRAALDLERVVIRAPISGYVSRPMVAVGAFLEAEAGPPLAEIVSLDPAVVAYDAPYADRLAALEASGAGSVEALLAGLRVRLRLPGGRLYPAEATPHAASADVDPATGAVTVWARFPNPDAILRPGMAVEVVSQAVVGAAEPLDPGREP
ncbi:efflux RND transporter periplasmic adaptor subunit [Rubrimonas cliftonensis]|uniref:Membrane fusion protein, multidrug efflux system n=1 Tax=Rubrimonas cliftonensis TaxID=89524 RepID=A0A1H4GG84_9RHOB|nr:efflux RND transporter periplasmic adaptor subunit [Rubrimonas cliftonensis]SEB08635.1 membrane fusion protein, multidrug efflux system [Rubrimonas cliftonensis]